jgi:hypothetical protein
MPMENGSDLAFPVWCGACKSYARSSGCALVCSIKFENFRKFSDDHEKSVLTINQRLS